jgi:hydroxymethylbilane synthase
MGNLNMANLRIGSRGSKLALWQANHVAALLREKGHAVEIEIIKTTGDKILDVSLAKVGTKGMFTKEIEEALADRRIDLAVHSLKDVPTELQPEFTLAAIMKREDPRDAFISVKYSAIDELPKAAKVGTSSLRRQCQLKALRPDLEIFPLRGNVDTRLRKLESGEYDAIILAAAGVKRLGLHKYARAWLRRLCVRRWARVRWRLRPAPATRKRFVTLSFSTMLKLAGRLSVNALCWEAWAEDARFRLGRMLRSWVA